MKTIVRILILLEFAAIIFVPGIYLSRPLLVLMFLSMALLVVLYWFAMFWVSRRDAESVLGHGIENDFFAGKLPADTTADLTRGRMCRHGDKLVLMKRTDGKARKEHHCEVAWSIDIDAIKSVGFGKILPARRGFILYLTGDDEIRFTSRRVAKDKSLLYRAIGWNVPQTED